ncbi:hypothetical protein H5410_009255, partial [Solanum commersonii]
MAEEAAISVPSPTAEQNQNSVNATIESGVQGGTESTCNNNNIAESSVVTSDGNREKSLEYADELTVKGSKASKDGDYAEAVECYSRSLEIRVAHFGELAPECINAYYKYGCALLYKAQDEADPLVSLPKKDSGSQQDSNRDGSVKSVVSCESSISSTAEPGGSSNGKEKVEDDAAEENEVEGDEEESDDEDLAEGDEDETDLDLAWKLLDVARAIAEKHAGDTMEKVDVLSALAEVALEREDVETSLSDYLKALSILERLVEPDSRHIAELNFRICLCLEIGSKHQEAIPYCQKAISTCKSRLQRLTEEIKLLSESTERLATTNVDQIARQSSSTSQSDSVSAKEAELEDLQLCMSNPSSILSDILGMVSAKARSMENADASVAVNSSQMGAGTSGSGSFDSPTVSTAHTNGAAGITHLGVVGRGVKRVHLNTTTESSPAKKPASEQPSDNGDDSEVDYFFERNDSCAGRP